MDTEAIKLIAKAEALEEQAKRLLEQARQYRLEADKLFCNLPKTNV